MAIKLNPTSSFTKFVIIALLTFACYLLYTLTLSVYNNYQLDIYIRAYEEVNERIRQENQQKIEDYEYFSSDRYVEKIAKQNLNLVNPGEEVIVLPKPEIQNVFSNSELALQQEQDRRSLSNPEKWWIFFFDTRR